MGERAATPPPDPGQPPRVEHTTKHGVRVGPSVPSGRCVVDLAPKPAEARERWIGGLQIRLTDASGAEVVRDFVGVDGKPDFVWSIGLAPGTYSLRCSAINDGSGTTTFTVGRAPQRVELQLAK